LAVCSLAKGYPVKASACKYDQFKAPACTPQVVKVNFAALGAGSSVQGPGTVVPGLDIEVPGGLGATEALVPGVNPAAYGAGPGNTVINGGLDSRGGFSDTNAVKNETPHHYVFSFANPISRFSLRMMDFGDYNPTKAEDHLVKFTAYDKIGVVYSDILQYKSDTATTGPTKSWDPDYGDLQTTGDALKALNSTLPKNPGRWTWLVTGQGILKVELQMFVGHDPYTAFDSLSYTPSSCP
jgi:hypothetical protein